MGALVTTWALQVEKPSPCRREASFLRRKQSLDIETHGLEDVGLAHGSKYAEADTCISFFFFFFAFLKVYLKHTLSQLKGR